jgi:DNA mismatch repair protein MutS2
MEFRPDNILSSFEFNKVLNMASLACAGVPAKKYFSEPEFYTNADYLNIELSSVDEFKNSLLSTSPLTIQEYHDITDHLKNISVINYVLAPEALQQINSIIRMSSSIVRYFNPAKAELYPELHKISTRIIDLNEIEKEISRIIDENGEIRDTASPRLHSIIKSISHKRAEIDKVFNHIAAELKNRGLLSETIETYRNNRRVLSLPAENKRKIRGIIHDESATGKTVYIEPEQIIELNNDLYDLEAEYRNEIYVILKKISNELRPFSDDINTNMKIIVGLDALSAKAKVAIKMNAFKPMLSPNPQFNFKTAYHPLLLLKNNSLNAVTVPFDLQIDKNDRIVVISGPNAGGKSVTLKALGLLQIMMQCGFLVTADENTTMGIYNKIFADIGDQQSVDDDLSTYSSRLRNMKEFVENADDKTLVLIDEFGTGTDPKIGGAIAEAVLDVLKKKKVHGVITTHYSNLKLYAFKNNGVVNASMHFDREILKPTYKLIPGKPGSSFAFEMAQNSGLDIRILRYARFKAGKTIKHIEDILVELQDNKSELEMKIIELNNKKNELDNLVRKNESLFNELQFSKKKLKLEKKEMMASELARKSSQLNKLINEISRNKILEDAILLAKKLEEDKKAVNEQIIETRNTLEKSAKTQLKELKTGDFARVKNGNIIGSILKITKGVATIQTDKFQIEAPLHTLESANKPLDTNSYKSVSTMVTNTSGFDSTLDIRGYTRSEAHDSLHTLFDNAILANASILKILHGKGNGTLKNLVREIAAEYNAISELWHPEPDQGGDGITFLKLR